MSRIRILLLLLVVYLLLLSACAPGPAAVEDAAEGEGAEAGINEVTFTAVEYSFEGPESIPAGWTRLTLDNQGELSHDLLPIKMGEGKSIDDVMEALEAEGPPEWATLYGQVTAEPGQRESYLVDLAPGNYVVLSFGSNEEGPPDAAQGMIHSLTVSEAEGEVAEAALPQADIEVDLVDYDFVVAGDVESGEQLVRVSNEGQQMHELAAFRLHEGVSFEDFQTMLESEEEPEGEPPFEEVGWTLLSPGVSTYITMDFDQPGNYVLVCFIPSPEHDMQPHAALGMVEQITIEE